MRTRLAPLCLAGVIAASPLAGQAFSFDAVPLATTTPFSLTAGGTTATFTTLGAPPSAFSITNSFFSPAMGSRVLYSADGLSNNLRIDFNRTLDSISLNFALNAGPFTPPNTLTLRAFLGGAFIGTAAVNNPAVPPGFGFPEGTLSFKLAGQGFDRVELDSPAIDMALGRFQVALIPEPSSLVLVLTGVAAIAVLSRRRRAR